MSKVALSRGLASPSSAGSRGSVGMADRVTLDVIDHPVGGVVRLLKRPTAIRGARPPGMRALLAAGDGPLRPARASRTHAAADRPCSPSAEVVLDGARADEQPRSNLRLGEPVAGQPRDLELSGCQLVAPFGRRRTVSPVASSLRQPVFRAQERQHRHDAQAKAIAAAHTVRDRRRDASQEQPATRTASRKRLAPTPFFEPPSVRVVASSGTDARGTQRPRPR
jgi:hypothetical protein